MLHQPIPDVVSQVYLNNISYEGFIQHAIPIWSSDTYCTGCNSNSG